MLTMKMTYEKSHLFMHTCHGKWLVDTGAPSSISPELRLSFDQNGYQRGFEVPATYMGISIPTLTDLVGVEFSGLLGTDILNEYDILWDIEAETMQLTENELDASSLGLVGNELAIGNIMGVPTLDVTCAGCSQTMFFDTGATHSYLTKFNEQLPPQAKEVDDFLPGFGKFTTKLTQINFEMDRVKYLLQTGELPPLIGMSLSLTGSEGIIGNEVMRHRRIGYFPRRRAMLIGASLPGKK
tara:strand:- start:111 stop:830 length:720 start_codon:yes stop_codon:yes gene_type:complete